MGYSRYKILHEQLAIAQKKMQEIKNQQRIKQQQYRFWQHNKIQLQQGLPFIIQNKHHSSLTQWLQNWQENNPQRQIRFESSIIKSPSLWHSHGAQRVHRLQMQYWVSDEYDLSRFWLEKRIWPCLAIVYLAQLSRAEPDGLWIEEESVCVQF
jgi:hypothetical protein